MDAHLRSNNIFLQLVHELQGHGGLDELWQTFRKTAVEPGQASSPDIFSFADECLLCAHVFVHAPTRAEDEKENDLSSWITQPLEGHTQESPQPPSTEPLPPPTDPEPREAGLIYLYSGPANHPAGEANIGVIMKNDMRRCGYAREAVELVLRWAFEELKFHRVQAAILDMPFKDRALRLFIGSGFAHEGTKRRAVYQPEGEGMAGVWKDVTYLAMLDTEWMLKSAWKRHNHVPERPVITAWDEMFARHSREREELLRWEEKHGRMRRSSSTETLREYTKNAAQDMAYLTDDASSIGEPSVSGSSPPSPRPNVVVTWEDDAHMTGVLNTYELNQRWEEVLEMTRAARQYRRDMEGSLLEPSLPGHMLALPSIPSTRISEGALQSPLTISSPSTPGSTPPPSPTPFSPVPSSVFSPRMDSEDEDNWLPREALPSPTVSIQFTMPPYVRLPATPRTVSRSSSSSSSSADSWSDAQSSVGSGSSNWDVISNTSEP